MQVHLLQSLHCVEVGGEIHALASLSPRKEIILLTVGPKTFIMKVLKKYIYKTFSNHRYERC
jgi:hypothetical protein